MPDLSGLPYFEVQFTNKGAVHDQSEVAELLQFLGADRVTDLFVMAHGWNNDMNDARSLYRQFFGAMRQVQDSNTVPGVQGRQFSILGMLWPSKKFAEKDLIPSGAAGAGSPVSEAFVKEQLDDLKGAFDDPSADATLERAKLLISRLDDSPAARREFVDLIRSLLPQGATDEEDASARFLNLGSDEVMNRLSRPVLPDRPAPRRGGTAGVESPLGQPTGSAAGLGQFFSGMKSGARNLLNYATYYQMKERASTVGRDGVTPLLGRVHAHRPDLKLHLIGHSFGGRLVTAAALGLANQPPIKLATLTLLQAAFSHHGFARRFNGTDDGAFRRVITDHQVLGPILVTCTQNDKAVGVAYPIASLIAGQAASALGDKTDPYGGIGRNGAQKTPEARDGTLLRLGGAYHFEAEKLHNLNADKFILDHSDICKNEVAYAILSGLATT